ncbi:hypothetical protein L0Z14_28215 [Burkholderia multivorans]|uniref:hypothetical protein n=1 Tax=Burkholderia multivorans TaxID=87883 RepID=UPI00201AA081|nr:hypothetical protein [Burkholderia multivorans]MCL4664795.1 hypothetical protein [Burkholderia multivorans]
MKEATNAERPWRDLTDPRRAIGVDDLEAGLKEPVFENLEIPEALGPVTITVDDHKIKRFPSRRTITCRGTCRTAQARSMARASVSYACSATISCSCSRRATAPARLSASIPKNRCGSTAP